MVNSLRPAAVALAVLLAAAAPGCHGGHSSWDTSLGPFLTIVDVSPTSITLSWSNELWPDAVLIEVHRYEEFDKKFRVVASLPPGTTLYADPTLDPELGYTYRLYAYFEKGPKKDSVDLSVTSEDREDEAPVAAHAAPDFGEAPWLGKVEAPRLAPDGESLAFVSDGLVRVLSLATGETRPAAAALPSSQTGAVFAPDGESLVVAAAGGLWRVPRAGGPAVPLIAGGHDPDLSPDGRLLAFAAPEGVVVLDLGTGERRLVAAAPARAPRFSPDGGRLAYLDGAGVRIADLAGGDRPAGAGAAGTLPLVFSPDGRSLAFLSLSGRVAVVPVPR